MTRGKMKKEEVRIESVGGERKNEKKWRRCKGKRDYVVW